MVRESQVKVGMVYSSNKCGDFVIDKYVSSREVYIRFVRTKTVIKSSTGHILRGLVSDPYAPLLCGRGFIGTKYPSHMNRKMTKEYRLWSGMLERCYGNNKASESYKRNKVQVNPVFYSFEYFHEFIQKVPNFGKEGWHMDKDLFGGKEYSPDTICFIPNKINIAMTTNDSRKKNNLPDGVRQVGSNYTARLRMNDKEVHLGSFKTPEEASSAYIDAKRRWVAALADDYKSELPDCVYRKLLNWKP